MTDFETSCGNTSALGATIGGAIGSVLGFFFD